MALDQNSRRRLAWTLAIAADFTQIVAFPLFGEGFASPLNDALDLGIGIALLALLGWHWSFVPAFAAELIPGVDMVPTWTASVLLATRGSGPKPPTQAVEVKNVTPPAKRLEP